VQRLTFIGVILGLASGCTRPNPNDCSDGTCTEPSLPFCDTGGEIAGMLETCIAVACTPGEFAACRDDTAITCNSVGTDYDVVRCNRGCDPAAGCRVCEANQSVCANGKAQTCDAAGTITASETCTLGCLDDQPRCREVAPSNGLAAYMDLAATGPDLVLDSATLLVPLGRVMGPGGQIDLHSEMVPASPGGAAIQVFPVRSLRVTGSVSVQRDPSSNETTPAIAFVVYGDVLINGSMQLGAGSGGKAPPPGATTTGDCVGVPGNWVIDMVAYFAGGGGGGGATAGGAGGGQYFPASAGGAASSSPDLQPLRGGCAGGTPPGFTPGHGGGAVQITSRSSIHLGKNASIEANGFVGFAGVLSGGFPGDETMPGGGGAGGGILLEAPAIILDAGAILAANGGAGTSGDRNPGSPAFGRALSLGGQCTSFLDICTGGGNGGSINGPGGSAASFVYIGQQQLLTGAGGGAVGTIRINTSSGVYLKANDVFESPIPSTGILATR
jgi:hypothetical protein